MRWCPLSWRVRSHGSVGSVNKYIDTRTQVNAKGQIHATTKLGHYLRVESPGSAGSGGGQHHTQHSVMRSSAAGGEVGGGEAAGDSSSPLAGGASSEFSFLQQLLDQ